MYAVFSNLSSFNIYTFLWLFPWFLFRSFYCSCCSLPHLPFNKPVNRSVLQVPSYPQSFYSYVSLMTFLSLRYLNKPKIGGFITHSFWKTSQSSADNSYEKFHPYEIFWNASFSLHRIDCINSKEIEEMEKLFRKVQMLGF